jgi:hypothetical protein
MLCPIRLSSPPTLKNGQDAPETSPIGLASAARTEPLQPAYSMTSHSQPIGKAAKDGCLFN